MRPSAHTAQAPSRITGHGPAAEPTCRTVDAAPTNGPPAAVVERGAPCDGCRSSLLVPILVGIIGGPVAPVGADELSDARARQSELAQQLKNQKAQIAEINSMQADLSSAIASTKRELSGINANLDSVKASIGVMIKKINVVKAQYAAQVLQLQQLDLALDRITVQENQMTIHLRDRKALLAERLRQAYDTDRTSMLETFLSGDSFTDVLSQVSYTIDVGEQDKALAEQIVTDQEALSSVQQSVNATRQATDDLRIDTAAQKVKLDAALVELKAAQAELKRLEAATKRALAIQNAAYAKLLSNKKHLAQAIAATASARHALAGRSRISSRSSSRWATSRRPTTERCAGRCPASSPSRSVAPACRTSRRSAAAPLPPGHRHRRAVARRSDRRATAGSRTSDGTTPTAPIRPGSSSSPTRRT